MGREPGQTSGLREKPAVKWGSPSVIIIHAGGKNLTSLKPLDLIFDLKTVIQSLVKVDSQV